MQDSSKNHPKVSVKRALYHTRMCVALTPPPPSFRVNYKKVTPPPLEGNESWFLLPIGLRRRFGLAARPLGQKPRSCSPPLEGRGT